MGGRVGGREKGGGRGKGCCGGEVRGGDESSMGVSPLCPCGRDPESGRIRVGPNPSRTESESGRIRVPSLSLRGAEAGPDGAANEEARGERPPTRRREARAGRGGLARRSSRRRNCIHNPYYGHHSSVVSIIRIRRVGDAELEAPWTVYSGLYILVCLRNSQAMH